MTEQALTAVRGFIQEQMAYAMYCANGIWKRGELVKVEALNTGSVAISFEIPISSDSETVTAVQLYDKQDAVWVEQETNITRMANEESLFFSIHIKVSSI